MDTPNDGNGGLFVEIDSSFPGVLPIALLKGSYQFLACDEAIRNPKDTENYGRKNSIVICIKR